MRASRISKQDAAAIGGEFLANVTGDAPECRGPAGPK
jgi:hypothetical protein